MVKRHEKKQKDLELKIQDLETQKKEIIIQEQQLLDQEEVGRRHDQEKYEQRKHEIQNANYTHKTSINQSLTKRVGEKSDVDKLLMQARENKEQIKKNNDIYQSVILERRRFLTYKNMRDKPGDVEAMVKALFEHFEKIRKTCFSSMAKENYSGVGSFEMITESNRALRALEKELKQFTVQKDDLRFSLYSMIIVMLQDNISMRLWINDLMQNQIEDSKRRLEDHVKLQSQKLIAEESKREKSYSMGKYDQS